MANGLGGFTQPRKRIVGKPEWGNKHLCANCGIRYYDMGSAGPVCPNCRTEAADEPQAKPRRGRKAKEAEAPAQPPKQAPPPPRKKDPETSPELEGEIEGIKAGDEEDEEKIIEDAAELGDESEDVTKVIDTVIVVDEN